MKTIIVYFSYTGNTKRLAEEKAAAEGAELLPLTLQKRRGNFLTYTAGSFAARGHKKAKLNEFSADFTRYDKIILAMPIWAGYPAPPINNILPLIPPGSSVELIFTSGSGNSQKSGDYVKRVLTARNIQVTGITDVKASEIR